MSLSVDDNVAKSFNILATSLSVLHNNFDSPSKIIFRSAYFSKIVFSCMNHINFLTPFIWQTCNISSIIIAELRKYCMFVYMNGVVMFKN